MAAREASRGLRLQQRLNRTHGKELICPSLCPFLARPPAARPLSNVFQPLLFFFFSFLYPSPFSLSLYPSRQPSSLQRISSIRGNGNVQNGRSTSSLPLRFFQGGRFLESRRCNTRVKWKWSVIKDVDDRIPPFESSVWLLIKRSDFTFFFIFPFLLCPLPSFGFTVFFLFDGYRTVFLDRMGRWISIVRFPLIFFFQRIGLFQRVALIQLFLSCVEFLNFCATPFFFWSFFFFV